MVTVTCPPGETVAGGKDLVALPWAATGAVPNSPSAPVIAATIITANIPLSIPLFSFGCLIAAI
jgi:hypothetical protein